jgi:glycosyltransferase involved in cell wall biosynthesis
MRVGIDAHMVGAQETGNETYIVNLLRALQAVEGEDRYIPLTPCPASLEAALGPTARARALRVPLGPSLLRVPLGIPLTAARHSLDLLHMTYFLPPICPIPTVVTVHDISFRVYPETFSRRDRLLLSWGVPLALRRATRIIAVSEFTKRDLLRRYGVPEEKVRVTHEAAAPEFEPVKDPTRLQAARRKYGLTFPYILSVGNLQPRKNLRALLEAFLSAKSERGIAHRLVVVGKRGWQAAAFLREVGVQGLEGEVVFTGYVPTEDLPDLYSAADLFVYPALYEGFGLPPLEAMACGTPVVASSAASLPEVLGEAALLVDPRDVRAMTSAILRVLGDADLARRLSGLGLAQARRFSWERTARETVEVYREALAVECARSDGRRVSSSP